ncbi:MAG: AAA family ATPase, partial [Bacteroidales bacterium]|nr:AAA family ATPase [Bacteroidales bacterium]
AKERPTPKQLFDELWSEGEICVLFATTGAGKSLLAVQIAESIASGEGINSLKNEAKAQKVLFFDFELSDKQFEIRYSVKDPTQDKQTDHYEFSKDFLRVELNNDAEIPPTKKYDTYVLESIEQCINATGAKVIIIDNITWIRSTLEKTQDAANLMQGLKKLKSKHELSMLILTHTPKRNNSHHITINDLAGSMMTGNFIDSCFAIGESANDKGARYLKQIKVRNFGFKYDAENVILCEIMKETNFTKFEFKGYGSESDHLKQFTNKDTEDLEYNVAELKRQEKSLREIADILGVSHTQVSRIIKKIEDKPPF